MRGAKQVTALAVMAALLVVGKWVLNVVPNVEVVSLFAALFGYVFGFIAVIPVTIFCTEEMLSWGFGSWVVAYYIYFNLIAVVFALLGKKNIKNPIIIVIAIVVLTTFFGVLTTAVDCFFTGLDGFFYKFSIIYVRGISFYAIHIVSNAIIFCLLFPPLKKLLITIKDKMFKKTEQN